MNEIQKLNWLNNFEKVFVRFKEVFKLNKNKDPQKQFAKYFGITPAYVNQLLHRNRPGISFIFTTSEKLGFTVDEMMSNGIDAKIYKLNFEAIKKSKKAKKESSA